MIPKKESHLRKDGSPSVPLYPVSCLNAASMICCTRAAMPTGQGAILQRTHFATEVSHDFGAEVFLNRSGAILLR